MCSDDGPPGGSARRSRESGSPLSVCIVNWNVRECLLRCLESLCAEGSGLDLEILLADNHSTDGSVPAVRERFPEVRILENRENVGFPKAMNQLLPLASGRHVLLLNPDTEVEPGALGTLVACLEGHPEAGAVTARLVSEAGAFQPECRRNFPTLLSELFELTTLSRLFPNHPWFGMWRMGDEEPSGFMEIPAASGACMLLRREVMDAVGPLDERCFMHMEDIDLCYRIRQQGWRIFLEPRATVVHLGMKSSELIRPYIRHYSYNGRYEFFRAHYGPSHALALRILVFGAMVPRIGYYGLRYLVNPSGRRQRTAESLYEYWLTLRWSLLLKEEPIEGVE